MENIAEVRPIVSALWRNKVALILSGLQIALTLAIVCNAINIMSLRFAMMQRPSGMNEADTFIVSSNGFGAEYNTVAATYADLATLRNLPGVRDAAPVVAVPLQGGGWTEDVYLTQEQGAPTTDDVAMYFTDDHGLDSYGASLIAGRNFTPAEIGMRDETGEAMPPNAIVTQALAQRLFPNESALGKEFYIDRKSAVTVIGVIARLQAADAHHTNVAGDPDMVEYSILIPQIYSDGSSATYLIRAEPGRRDELMKSVESKLSESNPGRVVEDIQPVEKLRSAVYREDRAMILVLGGVVIALLVVTALGIAGLANFWVAQRARQIGIRRAVGATRADILRYFLTENFIITSLGLVVGSVFTYAFGLCLLLHAETRLLPWYYLPIGCVCLCLLGQLAALGPALSASRVPPAVATRSA